MGRSGVCKRKEVSKEELFKKGLFDGPEESGCGFDRGSFGTSYCLWFESLIIVILLVCVGLVILSVFFEGGMDVGQERLVVRVRCFLERRTRDEDKVCELGTHDSPDKILR